MRLVRMRKCLFLQKTPHHFWGWLVTVLFLLTSPAVKGKLQYNAEPSDLDCASDQDCNSESKYGLEECGVCVESKKKEAKCLYPFPYMYKSNDINCTRSDPCPLTCLNGGKCVQFPPNPLVYAPECRCNLPYYGDECQYLISETEKRVPSISWIFKGFIPVVRLTSITVVVQSSVSPDYDHYDFYIFAKEGYSGYQFGKNKIVKGCYFKRDKCTGFKVQIRFPYKVYDKTNKTEFLSVKGEVVGYYSSFTLMLVNKKKTVYNRMFPIVVRYEAHNLKCVPTIKLRNCVPDMFTATTYTRPSIISLESEVVYISDGKYINKSVVDEDCAASANFIWKMWNFIGAHETDDPMFHSYTKSSWLFDPYSLAVGTYEVMLEVQQLQVRNMSSNVACCYFRIRYLPLIAVIGGGSDRMVYKEMGIYLSAALSSDPNQPRSQQDGLYAQWSCKRIQPPSDNDPMCVQKTTEYNRPYFITPDLLTYSAVYNFTLVVFSTRYTNCSEDDMCPSLEYAYVRIEVGNQTINSSFSIQCIHNCRDKVVTSQQLFLKVTSETVSSSHGSDFQWTFRKVLENKEKPVDDIKVEGMPPFMLLVDEDSFEVGTEYTISVRVYPAGEYAKYNFLTDEEVYEGSCTVYPETGIKGLTLFDIVCSTKQDSSFLYEFYDKSVDDLKSNIMFNGRMLGSASSGDLLGVQLTNGIVVIYIINVRGFYLKREISVRLAPFNITEAIMDEIKDNLSDSLTVFKNEPNSLRIISLIPKCIPPEWNKNDMYNYLLQNMYDISTDTLSIVKLTISTMYNVLTDLNRNSELQLQPIVLTDTLKIIEKQSESLKQFLSNKEHSGFLPPKEITQAVQLILHSIHEALHSKANRTIEVDLDDLSLQELVALELGAIHLEDIIDDIKDALSCAQVPGLPPTVVSTEDEHAVVWVLSNDKDYPITNYLQKKVPVNNISLQLLHSIEDNSRINPDVVTLQVAKFSDNIFWWLKSDIKTNMVSVSIALRDEREDSNTIKLRHVESLRYPLEVAIDVIKDISVIRVNGSAIQVEYDLTDDYLDLKVQIHRFDIKPRSLMSIMFLYPPTNVSLRVCMMEDFRPDFNKMIKDSIVISAQSPMYPHRYHEYDEPRFLYMGIIPGPDVPVNQTVDYAFQVFTTLCQFWNRGSWSSEGCLVGPNTQGEEVFCQCSHLSIFAAAFPVPPQDINPFSDAELFVTVFDNPLVVSLVASMLITYLLLFILLWTKDKKDSQKTSAIVLEDNHPLDNHPYLLAVFTSVRFGAGTTAHVGIKIFGSEATSRSHILASKDRKVLRTGSDDWFLLYCPEHLGKVTGIHIWHDNAGRSPSWFCAQIFVYDLKDKTETKFVVGEWLGLYYMKNKRYICFPEVYLWPIEEEDILELKREFLDNFVLGVRDSHMIVSVLYKHPRSEVPRVQRLSIIMLYIMVAMLCSIMFYKPTEGQAGVDDPQYSVQAREVIISIQSLIISVVLTILVMIAFRKSHKWKDGKNVTVGGKPATTSNNQQHISRAYTLFVKLVTSALKYPPLPPVQLSHSEPVREIRRVWYLVSWIVCFTVIFVSSYFIMLYGLKLGSVKSKKWLTAVMFTIGQENFVAGPARILLFALILSLAFQLIMEVNTYHINIQDIKDDILQRSYWDDEDLKQLLHTRSHQMYTPISSVLSTKMVKKLQLRSEWWSFLDFLAAACFVFVTCNAIFWIWTSHFYMNNHVQTMVTKTQVPYLESIQFYEIKNVTGFELYLHNLLNIIYDTRWYDDDMLDDLETKYWAADNTNRLIGRPRIRQLRTRPVPCGNSVIQNMVCVPRWKEKDEDTDPYAKGWNPGSHVDIHGKSSPWVYTDKTTSLLTPLVRLYGSSGRLFHNGGYSITLGPKREDVDRVLAEFRGQHWQDHNTRVVFVEFTLFNPTYRMFSQVTLVVEYMVSGQVLLKAQSISVDNFTFELNLWGILFLVFVVFYILRSVYLVNFHGLLEYITGGINNVCRLVVVFLALLSVALFFTHFYSTSHFAAQFQTSKLDLYFDFDSFTRNFVLLQITLSTVLCVAIFRLILSIRGGRRLYLHFYTFRISLRLIFWVVLVLLVMFFVLKQFTYLLNIFTSYGMKEVMINHNSMRYLTSEEFEDTHLKMYLFFKMVSIYFINSAFIVIFVKCTKLSKAHGFSSSERFNFITFLMSIISGKGNK